MRTEQNSGQHAAPRAQARPTRNPLPDRSKELEAFFFAGPDAGSEPHPVPTSTAISSSLVVPPTAGLFYDPLAAPQ
jgi:hypothetical protein